MTSEFLIETATEVADVAFGADEENCKHSYNYTTATMCSCRNAYVNVENYKLFGRNNELKDVYLAVLKKIPEKNPPLVSSGTLPEPP